MTIRKLCLLIAACFTAAIAFGQNKTFWKESFNSDRLPAGWTIPPTGNWDPQWIVTNQPYPGSYQYQQQAPPIASVSRGFHLQFQAGYFTDEDVDQWLKKKQYPDGYIISPAINCSGHASVILKFQQKFRWWNYHTHDTAGLFVGVSTDSIHWTQWDVRDGIGPSTDMFVPINEEINLSAVAANQPRVFLRFYWKGLQAWYWMVDDLALSESGKKDIGILRLLSQHESGNHFKKNDSLTLSLRNNGSETIKEKISISAVLDGKALPVSVLDADKTSLAPGENRVIHFAPVNLTGRPLHHLAFHADLPGDENEINNSLEQTISEDSAVLGKLSSWKKLDNGLELTSGFSKLKLLFYRSDIFRLWLAPDGEYTDPADSEMVISKHRDLPAISITEDPKNISVVTVSCKIIIQKAPILFSLYNRSGKLIWAEKSPLRFGSVTTQQLTRFPDEYFYGCGMQNGYFSHRNQVIKIEKGGGWDAGGRANPAPFYMSTRGYGAFRNTFDIGCYDFTERMRLSHNENRFDCFYFVGSSLKKILEGYTEITGRPFMPARWQLSMGDANCYNKPGRDKLPQSTPDVIRKVADKYIEQQMPRGWILPNDGYGCGYTKLDSTVMELKKRGFYTGLWTENGLDKIAGEVGKSGTRLCKLDVAWVGPGYRYALDACRAAFTGIENNSDSRGFVWSVMGWAGTQRYSVVWSGDQKGSWEYIRFHLPTVIGSGLSAQNCATGDVDGIFGGSAKTYTRDLQWKCFTPVFMVMSGWAKNDKQPWVFGEPYTSINRKYLALKMRLTPYMYTLMHEAHISGTPAVRGLVLEYPNDKTVLDTATQYEYLLGKSLLVAPVWKDEEKRDSIYLPAGNWIDYWDGRIYQGKQWVNNFQAPQDKLPLFVKAGAILPMYPAMDFDGQKPLDTLTLDIFPEKKSDFELYEDDGLSREYQSGKSATTKITCTQNENSIRIDIEPAQGQYAHMPTERNYFLQLHTSRLAGLITVNGIRAESHSTAGRKDLLMIPCGRWSLRKKIRVEIK